MVYRGHIENGGIVLDDSVNLPEGTKVSIEPFGSGELREDQAPPLTLNERLKPFIGKATGLPTDAALNHDHYLYGLPKR
jgi:hypothetical protein